MAHLLEILGRGLLVDLRAVFRGHFEQWKDGDDTRISAAIELLELGRCAESRQAFQDAVAGEKDGFPARIGLACCLDELGLVQAALDQLYAALSLRPADATVLFAAGFCQEKLRDTSRALAAYQAAVAVRPSFRAGHDRLVAIHLTVGDVGQAIVHAEQVCWLDPGDVDRALTLAGLYLRAELFDDAIERYQFAIAIDPENWTSRDDLISAYADAGRYEDAIAAVEEAIAKRPDCADQYVRLGNLLQETGREGDSSAAFRRAVELQPDHFEAAIQLGAAELNVGRFAEAAASFSRAIEINDRVVSAYAGLAAAQNAAGRYADGFESLKMGAAVEPNSTILFAEVTRLQMGIAAAPRSEAAPAQGLGFLANSIGQLRAAVARRSYQADLHYRLGLLLRHAGDLGGAVASYRRALEISPQYGKAMVKLSMALFESDNAEEAMAAAHRVHALDPHTINLHYELGLLFADRKEFGASLDRFVAEMGGEVQSEEYLEHIVLALENMGLLDRSAQTLRKLKAIHGAGKSARTAGRRSGGG